MVVRLDYGQAVVFLEKAVAEKGEDYIYTNSEWAINAREFMERNGKTMKCKYFDQGAPSCIVGHLLDYAGALRNPNIEGTSARHAIIRAGVYTDEKTTALLDEVQQLQDTGVPWGEAVRRAQGLD